ncbi:hypothetical protein quinque_009246 [Culex quinquefasciatus]
MNIALDNCSSGMSRQQLQNETVALRERNERIQEQLEIVFKQRQIKDTENRELEVETEREKNKINEMIYSLSESDQKKYREFQTLSESLKQQNTIFHNQISELEKQKERLNTIIMNSQTRTEAHRLKSKLKELIAKRNQMRDEENNRLSPAQEREKLINEVRSNNQALASIGKQLKIIEDQLNEKKEMLQQIDQDLEEGNSERHIKYKELKKRDEVMSAFMDTFQQNVESLKNQITFAIEQITLQGINMKTLGSERLESAGFTAKNDLNSHSGLIKEYKKLGIQLKQLQILEKRTIGQLSELRQEETEALGNIQKFSNLEAPRSEAIVKMSELTGTLQELEDKKRVTENVVDEAKKRNQEIKINLKSNETYRQISHLEDKLVDLIKENKSMQDVVEQLQKAESKLKVLGSEVDWSTVVRYLGLDLDSKLLYCYHIENRITLGITLLKKLYPIINRRSIALLKNKLSIYKKVVAPMLLYSSYRSRLQALVPLSHRKQDHPGHTVAQKVVPNHQSSVESIAQEQAVNLQKGGGSDAAVWQGCAITHMQKLQVVQNKFLRLILN